MTNHLADAGSVRLEPLGDEDPRYLGSFRLVGRLGSGGMGVVYAALDDSDACVAVKTVHRAYAADREFRDRFAREVALVRRVRAACVPRFRGSGVRAEVPWLATEYVPGWTLDAHARKGVVLTGTALTAFALGVAEALAAIHAAGVVHRDLKPGNVILSPTGPKVLDFGIARAVEGTALTSTGGLIGTPGWISPEQYEGQAATDRSDMFAWGGMVAFAASGRNPFGKGAADVLSYRTRNEDPDLAGVPDELSAVVRRAMDKDPDRRLSAAQVLGAITSGWNATRVRPVAAEEPTQVLPGLIATEWRGVAAPAPRKVRRRAPLLVLSAAALVALLFAVWLVVRPGAEGTPEPDPAAPGATEGDESEEGEVLAVVDSPEDAQAVLTQAFDQAMEATSFEAVRSSTAHEIASTEWLSYTEDPQPVFLSRAGADGTFDEVLGIGEGPDSVIQRFALSNDPQEVGYYQDPDIHERDRSRGERATAMRIIEQIIDSGTDVAYHGSEEVTEVSEHLNGLAEGRDAMTAPSQRYSGTFTGENWGLDSETGEPVLNALPETSFDLWIGQDGYPRYLRYFADGNLLESGERIAISHELLYLQFNEPVEIYVPDEADIADSLETARGEG